MGRALPRSATSAVASALFTPVQQRVLGLLFGQPERRFQSAELIRLAGSGTGAVHRQLQRLESAGLVTGSRDGNQKYYAARKDASTRSSLTVSSRRRSISSLGFVRSPSHRAFRKDETESGLVCELGQLALLGGEWELVAHTGFEPVLPP
ncbi:MAG: hypothetical protein ACXW5U_10500 [Thermoanaerobaculia bacterium]